MCCKLELDSSVTQIVSAPIEALSLLNTGAGERLETYSGTRGIVFFGVGGVFVGVASP